MRSDARLINHDLAPSGDGQRTWGTWEIFALWVGMAVCVPTYTLAADMVHGGMSAYQALATIALGNLIVLAPMILNGHAGARYGIPFPVLARASFGVLGANLPAILRALVACGWFGIQTWVGGSALYALARAVHPGSLGLPQVLPAFLELHTGPALAFLFFWAINVYFIWRGTESIRWLESLAAPFLLLMGLVLLFWARSKAGGFGEILSAPSQFGPGGAKEGKFWATFVPSLTAMVGFWATLSLNIPDFTRYAKSQRAQILGQALGLPPTMALFSFIGIAVTSATPAIFHVQEPIWDPVEVVTRVGGFVAVTLGMLGLSLATLSTNIAANVVSPANDFSNLSPARIDFRRGGLITAFIGILIMPWKLYNDPSAYIFKWLIGYSALLGPIAGIMIADYYLLRRRVLAVEDLYLLQGRYTFRGGWNPAALIALAVAVALSLPGFLVQVDLLAARSVPEVLLALYPYAWFDGFLVAGGLYLLLSRSPSREPATVAK